MGGHADFEVLVEEGLEEVVEFFGDGDGDVPVFVDAFLVEVAFLDEARVDSDHGEALGFCGVFC